MKSGLTRNILSFLLVLVIVFGLLSVMDDSFNKKTPTVGVDQLVSQINEGKVKSVIVKGTIMEVTLTDDSLEKIKKEPAESFSELMKNYGVSPEGLQKITYQVQDETGATFWLTAILPYLFPILLFGGIIWFMTRQVRGASNQAMSFGQVKSKDEGKKGHKEKVTFGDVAGVKEAKEELKEVVEFLVSPKKFLALGAKIPKGVLLMGGPGTGKTLLAKAVAGEANVPFFSISGSEFVEMFVGVGASRVRDLFARAKKSSPAIIFIDEIDAVGRQRGSGLGGSHDEREQTLNQILVEMDGFATETNVIVIAATNRPDVLDPALLRPGRFDRLVVIDQPDVNDREEILKIHAAKKVLAKDVDLREVAKRTPGFSGADLANTLNEAAILAARRNKKKIEQTEILESIEKVMLGPERKGRVILEKEKKITAYHEAGHALVAHLLPHADPVHKISIISRGRAAGYTLNLPTEDRMFKNKSQFLDEIAVLLAGMMAERLVFDEQTTGASNDLEKVTSITRRLITQYGMSDVLAPRSYGQREEMIFLGKEIHERRDYSEKVAEQIDAEITTIVNDNLKRVEEMLTKHRPQLDKIAEELIKKETIEKEDFNKLFSDDTK